MFARFADGFGEWVLPPARLFDEGLLSLLLFDGLGATELTEPLGPLTEAGLFARFADGFGALLLPFARLFGEGLLLFDGLGATELTEPLGLLVEADLFATLVEGRFPGFALRV